MKKKFLIIVVLILSVLLILSVCACSNNNDEEVLTTYIYSFTVESTDYTYELMIGSTGSWNLKLKKGSDVVYQFDDLSISKEGTSSYKLTKDTAYFTLNVNPNNTFEITSVSGEILNFILGYEVYVGDYTVISGNNNAEITLNSDGSCLIDDDEATFFPWNGGDIIISNSTSSVVCSINLEDKEIILKGVAVNDIGYIFDAKLYNFDFASYLNPENLSTKLYLSENSNKAYFQKTDQDESNPFSYHLYFGTYETTDRTVSFSYGDNNIDFLLDGFLFDYYYEEITVDDNWIKIYEQENKTIYQYADTTVIGDSIPSNEDSYLLYNFSQDISPVKITYLIDSENLSLIATYFGDFKGLEGITYTASDNSEIIIVDDNTLYHCSGDYTQTKFYTVETYSTANYDHNVLNLHTGYISNYYLYGDTFHIYSPFTNEEMLQVVNTPSQFIYGEDINIGEATPYIVVLVISSDNSEATLLTYNLAVGFIGTVQHNQIITGNLDIVENIYQITLDEYIYYITISEGVITAVSIG